MDEEPMPAAAPPAMAVCS
ncbi:hypothetical protein GQ600_20666 [Phytophthora cactorum]|nr:hypothetical protein GQ600_20666 [Phytophthora cactorum]